MNLQNRELDILLNHVPAGLITRDKAFNLFTDHFKHEDVEPGVRISNAMVFNTGYGMGDHVANMAQLFINRLSLPLKARSTGYKTDNAIIIQYDNQHSSACRSSQ